jgi:predicted RNA-binding protein YlqC (UPF0109 family)
MTNSHGAPVATVLRILNQIAQVIVKDAAAVEVEADETDNLTVLRLTVSANDLAALNGNQAHLARSLRTLIAAFRMKFRHDFVLVIEQRHVEQSS